MFIPSSIYNRDGSTNFAFAVFSFLFFYCIATWGHAQGLINNGANIVLNNTVTVYIDGTTGHYTNQNSGLIKNNTSGGTINMLGNWTNNAANVAFQNDGATVMLSGANQTIGGSNSTSFYNLTLAGSGTKTLNVSSITVGGQSTFNGILALGTRPLDLNGNRLNVSNSATGAITYSTGYVISETNAAVNSSILNRKTGTNTGSYVFPFGVSGTQIPVTFSITAAMGSSTDNVSLSTRATAASNNSPWAGASNVAAVSNMLSATLNADGSGQTIDRWWDITPSAAVTANVIFSYRGSENTLSVPYNTGNIGAQHWNGTKWETTVGAVSAVTSGVGTVTANGLKSFSPYVLTSLSVPLPVALLNFDYACDGKSILFNWCTASETNNDYFTLWHSLDLHNFKPLTTVPGHGNSSTKNYYRFLLDNKTYVNSYFRLSQTDFDGTTKFFKIIYVDDCLHKNEWIDIYNSGVNQLEINVDALSDHSYELHINNSLGQQLRKETFHVTSGKNLLHYDLAELGTGIYYIQFFSKEKCITKKIVIQ